MTLESRHDELIEYLKKGQFAEGIEDFYTVDVVAQENANPPRQGREVLAAAEREYLKGVTAYHGINVLATAIDDHGDESGIVFYECEMQWDHSDAGYVHVQQVVVERWRGGLIENIRFYGNFMP